MQRALTATVLMLVGCGSIDPEPPRDEDGNLIVSPGPFDRFLGVEAAYPEETGPLPTLHFVFDAYLDEDRLLDFAVVNVASAGLVAGGRVRWQMSTRTLEFTPYTDLAVGLEYRPVLDDTRLRSVTGAPLGVVELPTFRVVADSEEGAVPPLPDVRWPTVDALLESKCRSCHADPAWQLNPLTLDSLVGEQSDQIDGLLVLPFDPGDSYLLHKCLPDYPVRRFTVQPPPWSNAEPLTDAEVLLIERWIALGARP